MIANMTDGGGGFTGGKLPGLSLPHTVPEVPRVGQLLLSAGRPRGNVNLIQSFDPIVLGPGRLGYAKFGSKAFAHQVRTLVDAVLSNRRWSWDDIGLGSLGTAEREVTRMRAMDVGLIPRIPVDPLSLRADFSSGIIEERMPEAAGSRPTTCSSGS
jgi:hypothetical protein